ncbi:MAG: hypothetical protein ACNA7W_07615, partial [Pseudomonadales bacterium]
MDGTCIAHLHRGLLVAHGQDEAGSDDEYGHDEMWFAIRDRALEDPTITDDMFENLPLAPPPGYQGKAKAAPEATSVGSVTRLFEQIDPMVELTFLALARILHVEYGAYTTFKWAREVLADPDVSAAPEWAPAMVDNIQTEMNWRATRGVTRFTVSWRSWAPCRACHRRREPAGPSNGY